MSKRKRKKSKKSTQNSLNSQQNVVHLQSSYEQAIRPKAINQLWRWDNLNDENF
jgi:hypothetical protein